MTPTTKAPHAEGGEEGKDVVAEARGILEDVTPGPWRAGMTQIGDGGWTDRWMVISDVTLEWSRDIDANGNPSPYVTEVCDTPADYRGSPGRHGADARFIARARTLLPELAREVEALRAIVKRLPHTADGVPVTPGMAVYRLSPEGNPVVWKVNALALTRAVNPCDVNPVSTRKSYSTAAAALAAGRDGQEGAANG